MNTNIEYQMISLRGRIDDLEKNIGVCKMLLVERNLRLSREGKIGAKSSLVTARRMTQVRLGVSQYLLALLMPWSV